MLILSLKKALKAHWMKFLPGLRFLSWLDRNLGGIHEHRRNPGGVDALSIIATGRARLCGLSGPLGWKQSELEVAMGRHGRESYELILWRFSPAQNCLVDRYDPLILHSSRMEKGILFIKILQV